MTRKGLKIIKGLEKGKDAGLGKYSAEKPQEIQGRNKLEKIAPPIFI